MLFDFIMTGHPLIKYYLFTLIIAVPVIRVLQRAGFKPYWALLLGVPDVGLILCTAVLALKKWPKGA